MNSDRERTPIPVVSCVGRSNSGKTTVLEHLIAELRRRRHRIAVVKHYHRSDVEFDVPGKDSWRFAQTGAEQVILAAQDRVIHIRRCEQAPTLAEVVGEIRDVDLILVEGYKGAAVPKIEVNRRARDPELVCVGDEMLIAVVSDQCFDLDVPQFDLADAAGLADLVEAHYLGERQRR
ncbi:MAG TPA: molybdopterin-guanine dinucleotide biosynthesis protein B [Chloroflexi bacterium]|nr:molybdopterin-guanine dinucleotide biosynthesis protein B [Chloroflexota bacterium]